MNKILIASFMACSFSAVQAEIKQSLGVDQRVDYKALEALGPWDDRNYLLKKEDLDVLPEDDHYLSNVPAFFKIEKRRQEPTIGKYYPRSTLQHFQMLHGGLIVDGIWHKEGLGIGYHPEPADGKYEKVGGVNVKGVLIDPDLEVPFELSVRGNETTVECNPTNNQNCVAGSNGFRGQRMYYSHDAGLTWTLSQINPEDSCCDPTVDWSHDGSIVYQADLGGLVGLGTRWSRSLDQGVTWEPMKTIAPSGTDKEWIHVDRSSVSPHVDNVYVTFHIGNVMQFARSTDMGGSFSTPITFDTEPNGIGSDITTDSAGNVYYVYPSITGDGIRLLKSTDGGATFDAGVQVAPLNGIFDFPIPSMESREVFIYVSVDVDSNDNIYVAFTDEADDSIGGGGGNGTDFLMRRAVIKIAKSTDGGATWALTTAPHADDGQLNTANPIDRFHPWLKVDENDAVHVGFYDTRHSDNRTGVDFYYNVSTDGGSTWLPAGEQRYSTITSENIENGQEWGDYNGLSVVMDRIIMSWTDNRSNILGQTGMTAVVGPPTYITKLETNKIDVCAADTGLQINVNLESIKNYAQPVTLTVQDGAGVIQNEALSLSSLTPDGTSVFSFDAVSTGLSTGEYNVMIQSEGANQSDPLNPIVRQNTLVVSYSPAMAGASTLAAPADTTTDVSVTPTFMWSMDVNSNRYLLEVATDMAFTDVILSAEVETNSYTPTSAIPSSSVLYWRVTSISACGNTTSAIFSFTTEVLPNDCAIDEKEVDLAAFDFEQTNIIFTTAFDANEPDIDGENGFQGWTFEALVGNSTWSLMPPNASGTGTQAFNSTDLNTVSDNVLTSPVITIPSGTGPYNLRFWNEQVIESRSAGGCWDAAIVEISQNGGPFVQVTDDKMINDPYDGLIATGNPLAGLNGWCGDSQDGQVNSVIINEYEGSDIQIRFRIATDVEVGRGLGWTIDDVRVTACEATITN